MASTVEQHESSANTLKTFSSTMDMFETFKSTRSEERDSDEESFHLPMLVNDEDNKTLNGQTDDDILNSIDNDTNCPDIDQHSEDKLLNDDEDHLDTECASQEKNNKVSREGSKAPSEETYKSPHEETNPTTQDVKAPQEEHKPLHERKASQEEEEMETEPFETVNQKSVMCDNENHSDNGLKENEKMLVQGEIVLLNSKQESSKTDACENKTDNLRTQSSHKNVEKIDKVNANDDNQDDEFHEQGIPTARKGVAKNVIDIKDEQVENIKSRDVNNTESKFNSTEVETEETCPTEEETVKLGSEEDAKDTSQDEAKNSSLECEDLLNISVIRDVDEDNAAAIAEHNRDINGSEKSDNDEQDEDKLDSEMDHDNANSTDKDENMEFEDDENSSNFCETNDESTMDIGPSAKESDNDSNSASKDDKAMLAPVAGQIENEPNPETQVSSDKEENTKENKEKLSECLNLNKRPLTDVDQESAPKKIRLSDTPVIEPKNALGSFREFMMAKNLKVTRSDLEQFVLQKVCEGMMHKHELGEIHQSMKKSEQVIENLRKEVQQLTKQARDLDIVNKKLMNELKMQNGNKKPLVPLKITRSVGLQVKLTAANENTNRRRTIGAPSNHVSSPRTTTARNPPGPRPRTYTSNPTVCQAPSPRKSTQQPQPQQQQQTTPILSHALQQNRQTTSSTIPVKRIQAIKTKHPEPTKTAGQAGVIDLTDEDDKTSKLNATAGYKVVTKNISTVAQKNGPLTQSKQLSVKNINNQTKTVSIRNQVRPVLKTDTSARAVTTLSQGVRLTPAQVKNGIAIPTTVMTSNSGTTQVMYVVQNPSVVTSAGNTSQKTLLLNFQPNNGVLTSALNGSAVSVISKPANSVLKTVPLRKHPAPLPLPPPAVPNTTLKPLLPKPVLGIRKTDTGIILQWRMPYNLDLYEGIASYQLFAYQETVSPPSTEMWRKVGDVKALALPMACTLTQFVDKNKYYFAVRSVDVYKRLGAFSDPEEISL